MEALVPAGTDFFQDRRQYNSSVEEAVLDWGAHVYELYGDAFSCPDDALEYIAFIFSHYGWPIPPKDFAEDLFNNIVFFTDQWCPEFYFRGLSDVIMTDDHHWWEFVLKCEGSRFATVPPHESDLYTLWPDALESFQQLLNQPGLDHPHEYRPDEFSWLWSWTLDNTTDEDGSPRLAYVPDPKHEMYKSLYGSAFRDAMHMGLWAAAMWLINPVNDISRQWRHTYHPIFRATYDAGEALLYAGTIYTPIDYFKQQRAPGTCCVCGMRLFCCEVYEDGAGNYSYFCSAHRPPDANPGGLCHDSIGTVVSCEYCTLFGCPHAQNKVAVHPRRGRGQILKHTLRNNPNLLAGTVFDPNNGGSNVLLGS